MGVERGEEKPEQPVMNTGTFTETYRKSFSDWNLNIEDENPSSETSANFNGFLGITKNTANTTREENKLIYYLDIRMLIIALEKEKYLRQAKQR